MDDVLSTYMLRFYAHGWSHDTASLACRGLSPRTIRSMDGETDKLILMKRNSRFRAIMMSPH